MARLVHCEQLTVDQMTITVKVKGHGAFQSKENRDAVLRELKADRIAAKGRSRRGAQMHPEYVTDFAGDYETGFGNTDYQTYWKVLYFIEVI